MNRYLAGLAALILLVGCATEDGPTDMTQPPDLNPDPAACAGYEEPGPYAAGVTTLDFNGTPVEVWYPVVVADTAGMGKAQYDMREWLPLGERDKIPADDSPKMEMNAFRDATAASGEFPVVLFSHGMGGYRMQSSFLMTHLASWGYIVAAPEHPERGLAILVETGVPSGDDAPAAMRGALDLLKAEHTRAGSLLEGRVDSTRVAATGHSAGGGAVLEIANDPGITTWMTFASGGFGTGGGPAIPSFMMAGATDGVAAVAQIESAFDRQAADKKFLSIANMGHLGFTDICAIGADRGGVLQIALDYGIEVPQILLVLGNDGCDEASLAVEPGWKVVNHFTTAQLGYVMRGDDTGLEDDVTGCFGSNVDMYKHD